jgi:NAD+ diphosphatase
MTRAMSSERFRPGVVAPPSFSEALWFAFRGGELLVRESPPGAPRLADLADLALPATRQQFVGLLDDTPCFAVELSAEAAPPEGFRFTSLRGLFGRLGEAELEVAGTAFQIQEWDRTHQWCGACGAGLETKPKDRAKRCAPCGLEFYPRISPAVIVLVHDGPRVLLTRQARFPKGMYGLVAGFLEAGETLEACVRREVLEETGLHVDALRYFGSQPWPFPHQLMVGFFARAVGGELVVDHDELEEADWYSRDALPGIPPKASIARALLDAWLAEPPLG